MMQMAKGYSKQLLDVITNLENKQKLLVERMSQLDIEVSNIYHGIESVSMNPFQSYRVVLHLRSVLTERRQLKYDHAAIQSLIQSMGTHISPIKDAAKKALGRKDDLSNIDYTVGKQVITNILKKSATGLDKVFPVDDLEGAVTLVCQPVMD